MGINVANLEQQILGLLQSKGYERWNIHNGQRRKLVFGRLWGEILAELLKGAKLHLGSSLLEVS